MAEDILSGPNDVQGGSGNPIPTSQVSGLDTALASLVPITQTMSGGAAPFGFVKNPVSYDGGTGVFQVDSIWQIGYNMTLLPGHVNGVSQWYLALEHSYKVGANQEGYTDGVPHNTHEFYVNYVSPDGSSVTNYRPIFANVLADDNGSHASKVTVDIGVAGFPASRLNVDAGAGNTAFTVSGSGVTVKSGNFLRVGATDVLQKPATVDPHITFSKASPFTTTVTANTLYLATIQVNVPTTLTGIALYVGGTAAGNVIASLWDSTGAKLKESVSTVHDSSRQFGVQFVPFPSSYVAAPGTYVIGMIYSNATATFSRVSALGGGAQVSPGSFANPGSITPPAGTAWAQVPDMGTY